MAATPGYYKQLIDAFPDTESLTVLVAAGATRTQVIAALDVDLDMPLDDYGWHEDVDFTGWAVVNIPGGVLAIENSGYGDPTRAALRSVSANGGASAVVRHNIQAHQRFGCARDGQLVFDDDEYVYIEDPDMVPAELRPLFDLAWVDLANYQPGANTGPSGFVVGLAMAELVTGIELTSELVAAACDSEYFKAPSLVYAASLDG